MKQEHWEAIEKCNCGKNSICKLRQKAGDGHGRYPPSWRDIWRDTHTSARRGYISPN